ncbi:MAG: hypothetical protein NTW21_21705 [Verrucomicrobia bacterium]|nr:hypothetical protein [Verrucomicrobiota bacterium]
MNDPTVQSVRQWLMLDADGACASGSYRHTSHGCSVLLDDTPKVSVPPDIRLGKSFPAS